MKRKKAGLFFVAYLFLFLLMPRENAAGAESGYHVLNAPILTEDQGSGQVLTTWDCIWYGSYPQTRITAEDAVYAELSANQVWDANGDAELSGKRYRKTADSAGTPCYFRYDPIKWRVLRVNGSCVTLLSDSILEWQRYSDTDRLTASDSWAGSTIRSWLNGLSAKSNLYGKDYSGAASGFLTQAFPAEEQGAILTTVCYNNDMAYRTNTGKKTKDKIFLPAEADLCQTKEAGQFGFAVAYDFASWNRTAVYSEYAFHRMNPSDTLPESISEPCGWALRTNSYDPACNSGIDEMGRVRMHALADQGEPIKKNKEQAIRPMLHLDLSKLSVCYYAGTAGITAADTKETACGQQQATVKPAKEAQTPESGSTENRIAFFTAGQRYVKDGITYQGVINPYWYEDEEEYSRSTTEHQLTVIQIPDRATVTIPSRIKIAGKKWTVTAIGEKAAYRKKKIKILRLNDNIFTIGASAFEGCTALKRITIGKKTVLPAYLHRIEKRTFFGCTALQKLTVQNRITYIHQTAFRGAKRLKLRIQGTCLRFNNAPKTLSTESGRNTKRLWATVADAGTAVKWKSSNPSVVKVTKRKTGVTNGTTGNTITARKAGKARITIYSDGISCSFTVQVN